ncbi:MAG: DUF4058 family protein [Chloroflexota bacterium]
MPSPFPGMDPYIEQSEVWRDFHNNMASEIQGRLNELIHPRYYASLEVFTTYEDTEMGISRRGRPDVGVLAVRETQTVYEAQALAAAEPVEIRVPFGDVLKLFTVEIRTASERRLVTSIEILSPVNKQRGHEAHEGYLRKRRAILESDVHLIEIDLLRGGERPPLLDPVPPAPYYITLSRAERRPVATVWPVLLRNKLPVVPVPLLEPDPDVALDLGAAMTAVYKRGAYAVRIDYNALPPPPPLSPEEQTWAEMILKRELGPAIEMHNKIAKNLVNG